MRTLKSHSDIDSYLAKFNGRLSGASDDVPDGIAARIEQIFGSRISPLEVVDIIIRDVTEKGDEALINYTKKIDGVELSADSFRVSEEEIKKASSAVSRELIDAMTVARENIEIYQEQIVPNQPKPMNNRGVSVRTRIVPLASVGITVPSAQAPHPSTLMMCAVPAQSACVERIAVVTAPRKDGSVHPAILAACEVTGIEEIYRVGGAQAIAALAIGTQSIPRVDKVVGPGNMFVTLAKKQLFGRAGIEMLSGPSEVAILADDSARADFIAADMLSQAEHSPDAAAVLITVSSELAVAVEAEIKKQSETLERKNVAVESLENFGAVMVVEDLERAVDIVNRLSPEHLEVMLRDPAGIITEIKNAGAVFVGSYTPESAGDYSIGPSHVLPTGGSARFSSGLSVNDFYRRFAVMELTRDALAEQAGTIRALAKAEGLTAHLRSLEVRLGE